MVIICLQSYSSCLLFFILFLPVWIWIRIRIPNTDPRSWWIWIQFGSGSTALLYSIGFFRFIKPLGGSAPIAPLSCTHPTHHHERRYLHAERHPVFTVQADTVRAQLGDFTNFPLVIARHIHQWPPTNTCEKSAKRLGMQQITYWIPDVRPLRKTRTPDVLSGRKSVFV